MLFEWSSFVPTEDFDMGIAMSAAGTNYELLTAAMMFFIGSLQMLLDTISTIDDSISNPTTSNTNNKSSNK
jgi:hypothetical protein